MNEPARKLTDEPSRVRLRVIRRPYFHDIPECSHAGAYNTCRQTACRYHLQRKDGNAPRREHNKAFMCALDAANAGPLTLEESAALLGMTRERVRQIEWEALRKLERMGVDWHRFIGSRGG